MKVARYFKSMALVCALGFVGTAAAGENIGTSQADLPSFNSKLVLTNRTTNATVAYSLKWGNGEWKHYKLAPGEGREHWIPVKDGKYPTPHISFDSNAVAGQKNAVSYKLQGYEVGYNGYGAKTPYATVPKKYEFKTTGANRIDLFSEN